MIIIRNAYERSTRHIFSQENFCNQSFMKLCDQICFSKSSLLPFTSIPEHFLDVIHSRNVSSCQFYVVSSQMSNQINYIEIEICQMSYEHHYKTIQQFKISSLIYQSVQYSNRQCSGRF